MLQLKLLVEDHGHKTLKLSRLFYLHKFLFYNLEKLSFGDIFGASGVLYTRQKNIIKMKINFMLNKSALQAASSPFTIQLHQKPKYTNSAKLMSLFNF